MSNRPRLLRPLVVLALAAAIGALHAAPASALGRLLLIDEDSIDNSAPAILELAGLGLCGGGDPAVCVNDQFAVPGVRDVLNLPPGTILGNGVPGGTIAKLFTGQEFDEGWFLVPTIPVPARASTWGAVKSTYR